MAARCVVLSNLLNLLAIGLVSLLVAPLPAAFAECSPEMSNRFRQLAWVLSGGLSGLALLTLTQ